jgi:outer membrane protein insertion porin family
MLNRAWWGRAGFWAALFCLMPGVLWAQRPDSAQHQRRRVLARQPIIADIQIHGLTTLTENEVRNKLHSRKASDLPFVSKHRLRRDSDRLDSVSLHNWFHTQGYLDAELRLYYAFTDTTEMRASIEVSVREGVQTTLRHVELHVPDVPEVGRTEGFTDLLKTDEPFNPFILKQVQFDLKEAYANLGHPYARIVTDSVFGPNGRRLDLVLNCEPGPEVFFGDVRLPDLKWTKKHAVFRELRFKPGDRYSRKALLESEDRLFTSGLFDFVALEAEDRRYEGDTLPRFRVRGLERKPLFINARTGFRQDFLYNLIWSTQLEGGDRNFTGRGRRLQGSALADYALFHNSIFLQQLRYRFSAVYMEPWPVGVPLPTTLELAFEPAVKDPIRQYRIRRLEALATVLKRWSRKYRAWLTFKYEKVDIFSDDLFIDDKFRADSGLSTTHSVILNMWRDRRDTPLAPTRGSLTSASAEIAGRFLGGDNDFSRFEGSWARYYRREDSWNIIAHRILVGYLKGTGDPPRVPSQELYFLGGANTVRGFQENSIGPRNEFGDPLGGELVVVGNLELRRPLLGRFWMSLFVDIGNLWEKASDFKLSEWNMGAGVGLQFMSPVGPLRVDYGRRVIRVDLPEGDQFHVSIGYAF